MSKILSNKWAIITVCSIMYLVINLSYTFLFTDYHSLVWGDMKQFWGRAENHLNGDAFSVNQWSVWPVLYHILLAGQMRIADWMGLHEYRLEWILTFGIFLNATGVFFIYRVTEEIASLCDRPAKKAAAIAAFIFSISFPNIHLNAYILSESYAYPALMSAFYLTTCHRKNFIALALAGVLFGFASLVRPALGLIGLVFIGLLYSKNITFILWLKRCVAFTIPFALIITAGSLLTGYISGGKIVKPGGNGAIVFYIHHCEPSVWMIANKAFLKEGETYNNCLPYQKAKPPYSDMIEIEGTVLKDYSDCNGMIHGQPPALMLKSDHESLPAQLHSAPPWDSAYYWTKGLQCIIDDGITNHFIEHTKMFSNIFMFLFYPDNEFRDKDGEFTKIGTNLYILLSVWIDIFILIALLSPFFFSAEKKKSRDLNILTAVPFLVLLTSFIFAIDGRYLIPSMFVGYIVMSIYIIDSWQQRKEKHHNDSK